VRTVPVPCALFDSFHHLPRNGLRQEILIAPKAVPPSVLKVFNVLP